MGKKAPHADALNLIAYGMAKFAGSEKGKNLFAEQYLGCKNRSSFYKELISLGLAVSQNALSNRQDGFDCVFANGKAGWKAGNKPKQFEGYKSAINSVVGNLSADEYAAFVKDVISYETKGPESVSHSQRQLIEKAIEALNSKEALSSTPADSELGTQTVTAETEPIVDVSTSEPEQKIEEHEERLHTEAQWLLIQIGKLTGCDVFIARNDGSTTYHGEALGDSCIETLPRSGLEDKAYKRATLIDIIWLQKRKIVCAFEVECSTSIYSGILRMSDLAYSSYNAIDCYIVAQESRIDKVVEQLERPTFFNENISMKYISIEELRELYSSLGKMRVTPGSVTKQILDNYAHTIQ